MIAFLAVVVLFCARSATTNQSAGDFSSDLKIDFRVKVTARSALGWTFDSSYTHSRFLIPTI